MENHSLIHIGLLLGLISIFLYITGFSDDISQQESSTDHDESESMIIMEISSTAQSIPIPIPNTTLPQVLWMAPFLSGGGYCSEATAYIQHLHSSMPDRLVIDQHGDSINFEYMFGLPESLGKSLMEHIQRSYPIPTEDNPVVVVCHSEPGAWAPPMYSTSLCPPYETHMNERKLVYNVGRTMFETDRLPRGWPSRFDVMDEIWVPTHHHYEIFKKYGNLSDDRLWILPESVDTDFYKRDNTKTLSQIMRTLRLNSTLVSEDTFIFLSIFKWEDRKGWEFLISAYLQEFMGYSESEVVLYILTNAYHTTSDFETKMYDFISTNEVLQSITRASHLNHRYTTLSHSHSTDGDSQHSIETESNHSQSTDSGDIIWPKITLVPENVPHAYMPLIYQMSNAFVLPSRGEGWGRPHSEAMSVGIPVIATNWSGPTEFITDGYNGLLISVEGFDEIPTGAFRQHFWARPNVTNLREKLRYAYNNRENMAAMGRRAAEDMREKYCIACVGKLLEERFAYIGDKLAQQ